MEGTSVRAIVLTIACAVVFCSRPLSAQTAPPSGSVAPSPSSPASPPSSSENAFEREPAFDPAGPEVPTGSTSAGAWPAPRDEPSLLAVAFWTGAVLLAFAAGTAALRRWWPGARRFFPSEAIRVLGRRALTPAHTLYLVEIGYRVLRVGCTKEGITYLGEISDRDEVALVKTQATAGYKESESQSFRRALDGSLREAERSAPGVTHTEAAVSDPAVPDPLVEPGAAELKDELSQIRKTIERWRG